MNILQRLITDSDTIAIAGHMRPDGDCIGACMGLYEYINKVYPVKKVTVILNEVSLCFSYLENKDAYIKKADIYDLFISLDCGDIGRLGSASSIMKRAKHSMNIDHHTKNPLFADDNYVMEDASSTCEILYTLMDEDKVDFCIATALYTGIIHDTGVFKYTNTKKQTMEIAGKLIEKGIPFSNIIDKSFFLKTFTQLQIMGRCLLESIRVMDEKCIFSVVTKRTMEFYNAKPSDLEGVIDQLRTTEGVEVAILLSERQNGIFRVSMRSNNQVDVSEICRYFGGGGHMKAAGCEIQGSQYDVINNLTKHIEGQF